MGKIMNEISLERQLIVLCSKGSLMEEEKEYVKRIFDSDLDWKEILFQAISHRCLNILYYNLCKSGCIDKVDAEIVKIMMSQYELASLRNETYFKELDDLFAQFNKENVRVAILKGNYLSREVYPEIATRTFNDLDLLISIEDANKVVSIVENAGFIQGDYDKEKDEIVPGTRKQKLYHQMATHELQVCLKKTDYPFTRIMEVDFNHDILWKGNCPYRIDTKKLLERAETIRILESEAFILNKEDCLLQLICHLYKEAVVINWISNARDLKLYKFADIATFAIKYADSIDWQRFVELSNYYKCEKVVYYVLYYVKYLYGDVIPEGVLCHYEFDSYDFLNEYGVENEVPKQWKTKFSDRLFDPGRINELTEEITKKNSDFWSKRSM